MTKNAIQKKECCEVTTPTEQVATLTPVVDIYETEKGYKVIAEVPGVAQKDINISLEEDALLVEAFADLRYPGKVKYLRSFSIGRGLNLDDVHADLKQGVLTITLPKAEAAKPKLIEVHAKN